MVNRFLLIFLFFFSLGLSAMAHTENPHDELIIRMTDNGFEPREMTIVEGDEVLFINNDDTDRWPASNFHPTHTLYPEFDPLKGISPGESWKFKFEKPGSWRMHDHLIPHMTGTIVVLEGPTLSTNSQGRTLDADSQELSLWTKVKAFFKRLFSVKKSSTESVSVSEFKKLDEKAKYTKLEEIAATSGPEAAWKLVVDTYNTPQGVVGNPHDMAHLVGQLLFKEKGFDGLSVCTPLFAFGCYHGLMEVAFEGNSPAEYKKNISTARQGCEEIGDTRSPSHWSCIHGMGHGVATFRNFDLSKTLADCDLLDSAISTYCYDGVFMEASISAPPDFYNNDDPIYPCNAVEERHKTACARSQTQVMRLRMGLDTRGIAEACLASGNQTIIYHCTDALGYFIGQGSAGNAGKILSECGLIENEAAAAQCSAAAAGELVFQNSVGWQKAASAVCGGLSGEYKDRCHARVNQVKESYGRK